MLDNQGGGASANTERFTSSESSRRDVFQRRVLFFGTSTVMFQLLWRYRPRKIGPGCVCVIYIHTPSCTLPLWRGTWYGFGVHVIIRTRTISPAKAFESKARCLVQTAQPVINSSMMKKRLLPLWRRLGFVVVLCDLDYGSGVSPSLLAFFFSVSTPPRTAPTFLRTCRSRSRSSIS